LVSEKDVGVRMLARMPIKIERIDEVKDVQAELIEDAVR